MICMKKTYIQSNCSMKMFGWEETERKECFVVSIENKYAKRGRKQVVFGEAYG